jgi:uroporphyrinogen III methyltransferase/synthase
VTRAREQAAALVERLEAEGAAVIIAPTIAIVDPEDWGPADRAIGRLWAYRWAIFTSTNGVERLVARMAGHGLAADALRSCRLAAIGPATAEALTRRGLSPRLVPRAFVAEALLKALDAEDLRGGRVLLARAAEARDVLPAGLAARGAKVDVVPVYRTVADPAGGAVARTAVRAGGADAVVFTSPSTVIFFARLFEPGEAARLLAGSVVACIGPITAEAVRRHGLQPAVVADEYTVPGLARALAAHFQAAARPVAGP